MSADRQLIDHASGAVVVANLEIADSEWSRFWGLQFRASLPPGRGLLLVPCGSIHTFWMRFAIDVVWLDAHGSVVDVRRRVRPWRLAFAPRGIHAVLELPAGTAAVAPGAVLRLAPASMGQSDVPSSLAFLAGDESPAGQPR